MKREAGVCSQDFYVILKGRTAVENGVSVELPYKATIRASVARVYIPGIIGALIRGQYGQANTTTVKAYALSTAFAVVTDADLTTYVIHLDHKSGEKVLVSLAWDASAQEVITNNGFVVVRPGDTKIGPFQQINDNVNYTDLPLPIANEVLALKEIATKAGVP